AITFSLRPAASLHRSARRSVLAETKRLRVKRIDLEELIVNFDFVFVFAKLVIQTPQLIQHFHVARVLFEQRPQRENCNFRPTRRQRCFLQKQICLAIVGFPFQNFLQHFNRTLRVVFDLSLRFHYADWRGRDVEKTLLCRFSFCDFCATQQLAACEKLGLLLQNFLEERNRITEIAQLNCADRLEPTRAQRFAEFLLSSNSHTCGSAYHKMRCLRQYVRCQLAPLARRLPLIKALAAAFAIPEVSCPIFFLGAWVLPQRGWNFPGGQEFLWRDRELLLANRRDARLECRNSCRRRRG